MTGDAPDMLARLKRVVPSRWFAYAAPLRDAVLGGLSDALAWVYSLIAYAKLQTRITTATGLFLDLIALDYFGLFLRRRANEIDATFMARIKKELLRERVTRAGMIQALTNLTGKAPIVFEPRSTYDAGGWGTHCGYGLAGGYGNVVLNNQVFLTVYRPGLQGVPNVDGYGGYLGGYGVGAIEYIGASMVTGQVTDADIYATIEATKPSGALCWTKLI